MQWREVTEGKTLHLHYQYNMLLLAQTPELMLAMSG